MADSAPDYTNTTTFPAIASKAQMIQDLSDPNNLRNLYEYIARFANTNTSTWADPTAGLSGNIVGGVGDR